MKGPLATAATVAAILLIGDVESFAPPPGRAVASVQHHDGSIILPSRRRDGLLASNIDEAASDAEGRNEPPRPSRRVRVLASLKRKSRPLTLALLTFATLRFGAPNLLVPPARASAPIVLRANKKKDDPPMVQAEKKAEELRKKKSMEEFDAFMAKCNDIEDSEGKAARDAYEKEYQAEKAKAELQKARDVEKLKRSLLDKGQDPHTDLDAERQVFLLEHDVDLEKIAGTPQNEQMTKNFLKNRGKKPSGEERKFQRYIVACQVADVKARGVDPMEYFAGEEVREKTRAMYKMDDRVAEKVAKQYEGLMAEHGGRLTPSQGETPFVYAEEGVGAGAVASVAGGVSGKEAKAAERAAAKAKRAAEKEARTAERAAAREARAAEKAAAKEARATEKAAAKEAKLAEKAAGAAAVAGAVAAKETATVAATAASAIADDDVAATANGEVFAAAGTNAGSRDARSKAVAKPKSASKSGALAKVKEYATVRNAATVAVGAGALKFGLDYYKENNSGAAAERERQLKLILGNDEDDEEGDDDDEFEDDEDDDYAQFTQKKPAPSKSEPKAEAPKAPKPAPSPPPAPKPAPKPKRTLGIFSKRNADARETDLNALVAPNAEAPEFASLLAKILTFGAPGRFPEVASWGAMPIDKFDLEPAKALLTESRGDADLTDEQSAEIFANVVNCMIIDIVDLASSTLKGKDKDDKKAVEAINVVMDFMDHAASLFDAVAEDVTIKPVTYGGKLRKKDLEQMFSVYAGSSMMGGDQDRVDTLQLVFSIADKKAEGLMQKHMMKTMMNLMKNPEEMEGMLGDMPGMEGMEEMMKAMGGMEGMEGMGLPGMDGEMSPEDLKQTLGMMKDLMDSGQVSEEELTEVRSQFKEMYGSDISDLIKKASDEGAEGGMTDDERELLDMFKRILGED